jgi:hypothetical protein
VERLRAFARSPRLVMLLIALAAGVHGLVYIPLVEVNDETDSWSYLASANAIRDGSYSTPLKAGFYFVFPVGWFDITGARIEERAWQAPEHQAFRPPGYPLYVALFGERTVFAGDHLPVLLGQAVLFALGAWLLMLSVRRWWGEGVALLAGLLYAFDPWSCSARRSPEPWLWPASTPSPGPGRVAEQAGGLQPAPLPPRSRSYGPCSSSPSRWR